MDCDECKIWQWCLSEVKDPDDALRLLESLNECERCEKYDSSRST